MTSKPETIKLSQSQLWKLASVFLLVSGSRSYEQPVGQLLPAAAMPVAAAADDVIVFDVPGAANGTQAYGINPSGDIVGFYTGADLNPHGFLRTSGGSVTTFDAPGAVFGTQAYGINPAGEVTGYYFDASFNGHGFVRSSNGYLTSFDVPGDVGGTFPYGINDGGTVTGVYCDATNCHGFLRARSGAFTTFDPAFIQNLSGIINPAGAVTGYFFESPPPPVRSFVRESNGAVTQFEAPDVCQTGNGAFAAGINPAGVIVGAYVDGACVHFHGFLRQPSGAIATFDLPGASDTDPTAINQGGTVVGIYDAFHGFLRSPSGVFSKFDVPGAVNGFVPASINSQGSVAGYWFDVNAVPHGFLLQPR